MANWYGITKGSWSLSGTTATYKVEINGVLIDVAKLTGLASGLSEEALNNETTGIQVTEPIANDADNITTAGIITLPGELLGTSKVTLTLSNGSNYRIVAADADKSTISNVSATVAGTKVTVKGNISAGWFQTNDKTLTKIAEAKTGVTLATVSGTKSATTAEVVTNATPGEATANVVVNSDNGTITIKKDALDTTKVSLSTSYGYKLDMGADVTKSAISNLTKTASGTKVTVKGDIGVGWIQTNDKTLTYTSAAKTNQTLATVSGTTAVTSGDSSNKTAIENAVVVSNKGITIGEAALGTSKISLSTSYGYELAINGEDDGVKGLVLNAPVWSVSGTTATYKYDTDAGYMLADDKKSITYTKKTTTTIATLKGLTKGLANGTSTNAGKIVTVKDNVETLAGITVVPATPAVAADPDNNIEAKDAENAKIKLSKDVLTNTNVTLTPSTAYKGKYTLAVDAITEDEDNPGTFVGTVPTKSEEKNIWSISGNTATYKTVLTEYYSANGNTITYVKETVKTTLAKISGIKTGLVVKADGIYSADGSTKVIETTQDYVAPVEGKEAVAASTDPETGEEIPAQDAVEDVVEQIGTIKIYNGALDSKNVTVTDLNGNKYELDLDSEVTASGGTEQTWTENGSTTYTYKGKVTAGYDLDSTKKKIVYTKPVDTPASIVAISGLAKGLVVSKATDLDESTGEVLGNDGAGKLGIKQKKDFSGTEKEVFVELVKFGATDDPLTPENETKIITIDKAALGTSSVTVGKGYTLKLGVDENNEEFGKTEEPAADNAWRIKGSNLYYKSIIPAYYSYDSTNNKIIYHAEQDKGTLVTITGFNENIVVSDGTQKDASDVAVTAGKLGIITTVVDDSDPENPVTKENVFVEVISFGNPATAADPEADPPVEAETGTINILSKDALSNTHLRITQGDYEFELGDDLTTDDIKPAVDAESTKWYLSGTTANFKGVVQAGYELTENDKGKNTTVTYIPANTNYTIVKIEGLAKDLYVSKGTDKVAVEDGGTITLANATEGKLGYITKATVDGQETDVFEELVTFGTDNVDTEDIDESKIITLADKAIAGTTGIKIATGEGYELAISEASLTTDDELEESKKNTWVDGTTAGSYDYKIFTPEHYSYDKKDSGEKDVNDKPIMVDDKTKIVFHEDEYSETPIFSISGLKEGLVVCDSDNMNLIDYNVNGAEIEGSTPAKGKIGYTKEIEVDDGNGNTTTKTVFIEALEIDTTFNQITVNEGAFKASEENYEVVLTNGKDGDGEDSTFVLVLGKKFDGTTTLAQLETEPRVFTEQTTKDGKTTTTLFINKANTTGYEIIGEKIVYTPDSDGEPLVKVEGLASGLTFCDSDDINLIDYNSDGDAIEGSTPAKGYIGYTKEIEVDDDNGGTTTTTVFVGVAQVDTTRQEINIFSRDALTAGSVTITDLDAEDDNEDTNYNYSLVLDISKHATFEPVDSETAANNDIYQKGWKVVGKTAYLVGYTTAGYTLQDDPSKENYGSIIYTELEFDDISTAVATVTGLNSDLVADVNGQIEGIEITDNDSDGYVVTLSKEVLGDNPIELILPENASNYTLDLADNCAATKSNTWSVKAASGTKTATYTEAITKGWKVEEIAPEEDPEEPSGSDPDVVTNPDGEPASEPEPNVVGRIEFTPESTTKTEITNLNSTVDVAELTADEEAAQDSDDPDANKINGITVTTDEDGKKIFTVTNTDVLTNKDATLKNASGKAYELKLEENLLAETEDPYWDKANNSTVATYKQKTKAGYTQTVGNNLTIFYAKDDKVIDLVAINGIQKAIVPEDDGSIIGLEVTTDDEGNPVVKVDKEILAQSNVTIDKTKFPSYNIALNGEAEDFAVQEDEAHWNYDKQNGKATLIKGNTEGWAFKQTGGANTPDNEEDDVYDYKTLVYTKAAPVTLATVSGISKKLTWSSDSPETLEGVEFAEATPAEKDAEGNVIVDAVDGTITLSDKALEGTTKVTLGTSDKYVLDFDGDVKTPEDQANVWSADGKGNAKYQYDTTAGWELTNTKTASWAKEKTTVLATVSGLTNGWNTWKKETVNGKSVNVDHPEYTKDGIEVSDHSLDEDDKIVANSGAITITDDALLAKKDVKITSTAYTLEIDENFNKQNFEEPKWYGSGNTVTLKSGETEGYNPAAEENNKTIKYYKENPNDTRATISGLVGVKMSTATDIDENGKQVGAGKLGVYETKKIDNEDKQVFVECITFEEGGDGGGTITLNSKVVGTSDVKIANGSYKDGAETKKYTYAFDETSLGAPETNDPVWSGGSGTLKLNQRTSAGFTLSEDGTTFKYSKEQNPIVATISGLNTSLKVSTATDKNAAGELVGAGKIGIVNNNVFTEVADAISYSDTVITVKKEALGTSKVAVSGNYGYTLALDSEIPEDPEEVTEWVTSSTTANYKTYVKDYYTLAKDEKSISYKAPETKTTILTVKGVEKDSNFNVDGLLDTENKVIKLGSAQLATDKVTLDKGDGYKLLFNGLTENKTKNAASGDYISTVIRDESWSAVSSGNATLKGTLTKGYTLAADNKSITYQKEDKAGQLVAKITGLNTNLKTISDSSGVINLDTDQLTTKTVTVTGEGYTLGLDSSKNPTVTLRETTPVTIASGTASVVGTSTAGHVLSVDKKSAVYKSAVTSAKALATIKGVKADAEFTAEGNDKNVDAANKKITLSNSQLNDKVTITGGLFSFDFANDYAEASITGSADSDSIKVSGANVSVNAVGGDDYIDFDANNNETTTFFYASGNGNDVIANFGEEDKINLTNSTITGDNITKDGTDAIIKVGSNTIKLQNWGTDTTKEIHIIDKSKKETAYSWVAAREGFVGELVDNSAGNSCVLADFEATATPVLAKQNAIAYGGKDKK
ncbi:MAG: hypothetical protein IKT98_05050 [Selenomonadaceae bacterium]|nr:hypothetical protein [Selenomonadaceae bacterium]